MKFVDAFKYLDEEPYRPYKGSYAVAKLPTLGLEVRKVHGSYEHIEQKGKYSPTVTELNSSEWKVEQIVLGEVYRDSKYE